MKKILVAVAAFLLTGALLTELYSAMLGSATWLVIVTVIIVGTSVLARERLRSYIFRTVIFVIAIPVILTVGANDRNATSAEVNTVRDYVNSRFERDVFTIVSFKVSNEEIPNSDQYNIFNWNNFKAVIENRAGQQFTVYGNNEGFGNITSLADDYFIIKNVYAYSSNAENIEVVLKNAKGTDSWLGDKWSDHEVELYFDVNCANINKSELNKSSELTKVQKMRMAIINSESLEDLSIYITYKCSDGEVRLNNNVFEN